MHVADPDVVLITGCNFEPYMPNIHETIAVFDDGSSVDGMKVSGCIHVAVVDLRRRGEDGEGREKCVRVSEVIGVQEGRKQQQCDGRQPWCASM